VPLVVAVIAVALILLSYWQISRPQPSVRVSFDLATTPDQYQFVEKKNDVIRFVMQPDAHANIHYRVRNHGEIPIHNVTLHFEQVSEGVSLLFSANESYPEPFALEYGTIEALSNDGAMYAAILKTFNNEGSYVIQCRIASQEVSYPFTLIVDVTTKA
jgi:hypothetical protein